MSGALQCFLSTRQGAQFNSEEERVMMSNTQHPRLLASFSKTGIGLFCDAEINFKTVNAEWWAWKPVLKHLRSTKCPDASTDINLCVHKLCKKTLHLHVLIE